MLNVSAPATIKNILVATDFSPLWEVAFPFVSAVARRHQANVTFLNVLPVPMYPEIPLDPYPPGEEVEREEVSAKLTSVAKLIPVPDSQKSIVVKVGDTVQSVLETAQDHNVDLIVVTTHGHKGIYRLVLGSTAEQILRRATCPVLSIGPKTDRNLDFENFHTILVPVDFSEESAKAAQFAAGLSLDHHARIVLLHIIDRSAAPHLIETARVYAEREIEGIDTGGLETDRIVRVGHAEEEIVQAAREFTVPCMVMGRHKHGVLSTYLSYTTLHSVLSNAPCPVFSVA